jgi:hypothetical protein
MPRSSERSALLKNFVQVLRLMMLFDDDSTEDFDDMMELYCLAAGNRYFNARTNIPKPVDFCNVIFDYPETSFRTIARCTKASFFRLMNLIQDHSIFKNNSKNKQAPVHSQLIIVLNRLGCDGYFALWKVLRYNREIYRDYVYQREIYRAKENQKTNVSTPWTERCCRHR